ncbi:MAG: redoxin domain-containing protein [Methanomassiliicoccales archaeon]
MGLDIGPAVGTKAPDFTAPDEMMRPYHMLDALEKGNLFVTFYPADFGMMCAVVMRTFKEMMEQFAAAGVQLIAISTNTTYSHGYFKDAIHINFPLLADVEGKVASLYGVLSGEEGYLKGRSTRAVFLVDGAGIIEYKWVAEDPAYEPNYDEMLAAALKIKRA